MPFGEHNNKQLNKSQETCCFSLLTFSCCGGEELLWTFRSLKNKRRKQVNWGRLSLKKNLAAFPAAATKKPEQNQFKDSSF